jgi:ankyrin repeat protein
MSKQIDTDLGLVRKNGLYLEYVKNKTPEIMLAAVLKNGNALKFVEHQTRELELAAISENAYAIVHVNNQTEETCLAAARKNGHSLIYIKNQTPDIVLAAVSQNGFAIGRSKLITEDIVLAALFQAGYELLNYSAMNGINEVVSILLKNEVPVDHVNKRYTSTPFQLATANDHIACMVMLAEFGANIHIKEISYNSNCLCNVIYNINTEDSLCAPTIVTLLELGVSPTEKDNKGDNAILLAIDKPEIDAVIKAFTIKETIKSMVNADKEDSPKKAKIQIKTPDGKRNVLSEYIARADYNYLDEVINTVSLLLEMGISPRDHDINGDTAMTLAKDRPEIIALIKSFEIKEMINSVIDTSPKSVNKSSGTF